MKKDFMKFYVQQQKQYTEMTKVLEKINKELQEGKCTQEQRDSFQIYYNTIKANYDRLSYVRHLLSLPPKFIQDIQLNKRKREFEKQQKELAKANKADEEAVLAENQEALDSMKDLLNEVSSEGAE